MVCLLDLASMELFLQSPFPPSKAFLVSAKTSYGCDEVLRSICDMDESSSFGLSILEFQLRKRGEHQTTDTTGHFSSLLFFGLTDSMPQGGARLVF